MSRGPATATRGRLTLAEAAAESGLSFAEVYRRCAKGIRGQIPSAQQDASGVWTIQRGDLRLLTRRGPSKDKRPPPTMLRPTHERLAAWQAVAKKQGCTVGELALRLLDEAAGWKDHATSTTSTETAAAFLSTYRGRGGR